MYPTPNPLSRPRIKKPTLTFAPLAWLKLQYFCHEGPTEIGGFGILAEEDPLYVKDFVTVRQVVSPVTVAFQDEGVADFFDGCIDRGISLQRCARLWIHTHPGASVTPSRTDEDTFVRIFGRCDWAVMFILGRTGRTYARMALSAGPGAALKLKTVVDWRSWPDWLVTCPKGLAPWHAQWQQEYAANIQPLPDFVHRESFPPSASPDFVGEEDQAWEFPW